MNRDVQLFHRSRRGVMMRVAWCVPAVVLLCGSLGAVLYGQVSDADKKKRDAFLKAREEMRTVASPTPKKSGTARPKPAAKKGKKKAKATATPKKKAKPTAKPKKATTPKTTATPRPQQTPVAEEAAPIQPALPVATPPPPAPRVVPTPAGRAPAARLPDEITIEKSGLEEAQGYEPPPPPPPRRGFFARLFGGGRAAPRSYRYLNRSVIEAIRRAPVQRSRWKFIIVHNSATRQGNARAFDYYHRRVKRMRNGMAYHFVVGNGRSSGDGEIEIGDRWRRQINGGHVHSDYLNNISIGICLVGDFNRDQPTRAQLLATEELIRYLRERCGKADGRTIGVRSHKEMNPPRRATDCPGDAFPYAWFRRF